MASRGQSITLTYTAWNNSTNAPQTGDTANHTLYWCHDGTNAATTNSPAGVTSPADVGESTITLTSAECTANFGKLSGKSTTANVVIIPIAVSFEQLPASAPGTANGLPVLDGGGHLIAYSVSQAGPDTAGTTTLLSRVGSTLSISGGKVAATAAAGDVADAAAVKTTIGVAGVGLTNLGDARIANLDTNVASRSAPATAQVIDLTTPITNIKTATVGGALHGAWISGFGQIVLDRVGKALKVFGINLDAPGGTPIKSFSLDDGTAPTSRT